MIANAPLGTILFSTSCFTCGASGYNGCSWFPSLSINSTPVSTDLEFSPPYSHFQVSLGQAVQQDKRPKRLSVKNLLVSVTGLLSSSISK